LVAVNDERVAERFDLKIKRLFASACISSYVVDLQPPGA
jgi:hypothetical protein